MARLTRFARIRIFFYACAGANALATIPVAHGVGRSICLLIALAMPLMILTVYIDAKAEE